MRRLLIADLLFAAVLPVSRAFAQSSFLPVRNPFVDPTPTPLPASVLPDATNIIVLIAGLVAVGVSVAIIFVMAQSSRS